MIQTTQKYKRSLSGSIGSGLKSVMGNSGRRFYVIEHKVSSLYHKAGESQRIIIDQIELGRDPKCQVRFDESFTTVSRRHAAIVRDGDNWKLVQLSQTNSTYLNGHRVDKEWYLQNGDEIQLSTNGPKMGFVVPQGDSGLVKSIGLTARMNLFRQQALKPYKTALTILSCVLFVSVASLLTLNILTQQRARENSLRLAEEIQANKDNKALVDSLSLELAESNKKIKEYEGVIDKMSKSLTSANKRIKILEDAFPAPISQNSLIPKELMESVYFCGLVISLEGEDIATLCGTAFLLDDGRLVTAQHVVNPILYPDLNDEMSKNLNILINAFPEKFEYTFVAVSMSNDRIVKKFSAKSNIFNMGKYDTEILGSVEIDGIPFNVTCAKDYACDDRDYAWIQVGKEGNIHYDSNLSSSLPLGTPLHILGFPRGVGAEDLSHITPFYSSSSVAKEGLDVDGCILLSNSETDHGNSGGPVFIQKGKDFICVGILSGSNRLGSKTGATSSDAKWKDRVVPISAIN